MRCWFNPLFQISMNVGMQTFGQCVKNNYKDFDIDDNTYYHMIRAFTKGLDKEYLPSELDNFFNWDANDAWQQLALNRNFVKIDDNVITADNVSLLWSTLKTLFIENKLNIDEIKVEIKKINDDTKSSILNQTLLKTVLNGGVETLKDYLK